MIKLNNISIRNKLIIMLVFTSLLVLGLFFVIFIVSDIRAFKERKAQDMVSVAQVTASNIAVALRFDDKDEALGTIRQLQITNPHIERVIVLDKSGKIFTEYRDGEEDTVAFPSNSHYEASLFHDDHLYVSADVNEGPETLGKLLMKLGVTDLQEMKKEKSRLAILLLIAALAFSLLIAVLIQNYFSKRLLHVVGAMQEVRRTGDYSQSIQDDGKDELSILIKGYNELMKQVHESQQRKDEFIGIASHELRTPLTSIKGYMELLALEDANMPNQQFVQRAHDNVEKLERLIKELLDVAKIQNGQLQLNKDEFRMSELLKETIDSFQLTSHTHQIVWERPADDEVIIADKQRIEQVLINLLSNAIKYSPGESKVMVSNMRTEKEVIVKVRDFGMGIPADEQPHIFKRFYRSNSVPGRISGFGLGLYISKDIINRHEGNMWVQSEEKGSAFYFSLPLANGHAAANNNLPG